MSSKRTFLLSVARTFIVTCNTLMKNIFGRIRSVHIKTFVKKLMYIEKQIFDFMSLGRWLTNQPTNQNSNLRPDIQILGQEFKSSSESFRYAAGYLKTKLPTRWCSDLPIYMALVFIFLINLKTRFDKTLDQISEHQNLGRGNVD